jgi:hypothetical protein
MSNFIAETRDAARAACDTAHEGNVDALKATRAHNLLKQNVNFASALIVTHTFLS